MIAIITVCPIYVYIYNIYMTYHISQCIVPPKYFGVTMCPRGPHLVKCAVIFSILILCPVLHHIPFHQYLTAEEIVLIPFACFPLRWD